MAVDLYRHNTVYSEDGVFAGWPANHGRWQWGNELLFGFMRGPYCRAGMHRISQPYEKVLARSLDGGESWSIETPNVDFNCKSVHETIHGDFQPESSIIRVCGVYDTGGEECYQGGGFYTSYDRGKTWSDAFPFVGLEHLYRDRNLWCTSRTCVVPNSNILFTSYAECFSFGSDRTFCIRWNGSEFEPVSIVCHDQYRAVMPSLTVIDDKIFVAVRRRDQEGRCWIDLFSSCDNYRSWNFVNTVAHTGRDNGNPPALICHDETLLCAFGNRSSKSIFVGRSNDFGSTWTLRTIRGFGKSDIGYPILFRREDGVIVCVYYWADGGVANCQRIESTIFTLDDLI